MFTATLKDGWEWPWSEAKRSSWWRFRQWTPGKHQANGPQSRGAPLAIEMGPKDQILNFGNILTIAGQGAHFKETNLPKYIMKTELGHRNA